MPSCPLHVVIIGEDGEDEGLDGPLQNQGGGRTLSMPCAHIVHRTYCTQKIHCTQNT